MGLYSQGNAFSRKVVNRKVLALILNFSTVGQGVGVWIILAYKPEGSTSILWKRHIFKAVGGAIMGGGGVRYDYGAFFTSKNAIFLFGHSSEHDK